MIRFSNGHAFEFMAASGSLGFDGKGWPWEFPLRWAGLLKPELFTIVLKSLTLHPRCGNLSLWKPWSCVRLLRGGAVNAVGLTNPGIDAWIRDIYPLIEKSGLNFVVSIHGEKLEEYLEMAKWLSGCRCLKGLEINVSCPNTESGLPDDTRSVIDTAVAMHAVSDFPLILKLSPAHDYLAIAEEAAKHVEAISINSVPWRMIFPGKKSPLARLGGGGVSGKRAQPWTWRMAEEISRTAGVPVIGAGVWEYGDIARLFDLGCSAVSFGSLFLRYPWRPTAFVRRWKRSKN